MITDWRSPRLNAGAAACLSMLVLSLCLALTSQCSQADDTVDAVRNIDRSAMAGRWYEIARYPHWFEKTLTDVSAICVFKEDDRIIVRTTAYNPDQKEWRRLRGEGKHHGPGGAGRYRLRFIWPFTRTYKILYIDDGDRYTEAIVVDNKGHAWILARKTDISAEDYKDLVEKAANLGIETDRLQKVKHGDRKPPKKD